MNTDNMNNLPRAITRTSPENYCLMNEKEKDLEIQKAVDRLQRRIQAILYLLDKDMHHAAGTEAERAMRDLS